MATTYHNNKPIPTLVVIVPCLNEEEVLETTHRSLVHILDSLEQEGRITDKSFVLYVDDGSTDNTWQIIKNLSGPYASGIKLSRNFGHQSALLAGMESAEQTADIIVTIDADLQDDPLAINEMISLYEEGAEIVYGVRKDRRTDSQFKRITAKAFYDTMNKLGVDCIGNHADFRLMTTRAVSDLLKYGERNLFLRGIIPMIGYRQEKVWYERKPRMGGTTKYPLHRMLDFAVNGITSFSVRPVRMLFWIGLIFILTAIGVAVYSVVRYFSGETIEGWTSLMLSIWFCTGSLLMGLGIIGEYIGKIYIEVKKRPRYIIAERS